MKMTTHPKAEHMATSPNQWEEALWAHTAATGSPSPVLLFLRGHGARRPSGGRSGMARQGRACVSSMYRLLWEKF